MGRVLHPTTRSSSVHHADAAAHLVPAVLSRSSSAHGLFRPPVDVGATGSILSLVDRERVASSADAPSSCPDPDQRLWMQSWRSKSTNRLPKHEKQGGAGRYTLETVAENAGKVPKWKQFLRKFKGGSKKSDGSKNSKPSRTAFNVLGKQQAGGESLRDEQTKAAASRGKQVSTILYKPSPLPERMEKPTTLLWERRSVAVVVPLDLTRLKAKRIAWLR